MKNSTKLIGGEHGFKVNTPGLIKEITDNGLRENSGVLKIPINIFMKYLDSVATRASQLNDPILNKLMCDMALYEVANPESKEYDSKVIEEVYQKAEEQCKTESHENV
jgi:hypothetical protein